MAYYFVCDGGGSKTECFLFDHRGHILAKSRGAEANALFSTKEKAAEEVIGQLDGALREAGLKKEQLAAVQLFIPGFRECESILRSWLPETVDLRICGDEPNAFYGALGAPEGIAILSGTGSFATGKTKNGPLLSVGGWGPVMGDQGSGYHIGKLCLEKIAQLADSGRENTILVEKVLQYLGASSVLSLRRWSCGPECTRKKIASLCPVVAEAARQADPDAQQILRTAAEALAELALCLAQKLNRTDLPVVLIGGVSQMGDIFTDPFTEAVHRRLPAAECRKAIYSPAQGAVLCVLHQIAGADISDPEILKNITEKTGDRL